MVLLKYQNASNISFRDLHCSLGPLHKLKYTMLSNLGMYATVMRKESQGNRYR